MSMTTELSSIHIAVKEHSQSFASQVLDVARTANNETNLRHEIEILIRQKCQNIGIPYVPFQLEHPLYGNQQQPIFADVVHGGIIIEYESPRSFSAGASNAKIRHAQHQAEKYAERMVQEEGRAIDEYSLTVWDGTHIAFGYTDGHSPNWERLVAFDTKQAGKLLSKLHHQGRPLVHPKLLRDWIGPESDMGTALIPVLFRAIVKASTNPQEQGKTTLLYKEWKRLFGQAVGISTQQLERFLQQQQESHGQNYSNHVPCYLFALHTYIALIAKLVTALALPNVSQNIKDSSVNLKNRIEKLEDNSLFLNAGITNMLSGDFFSWPVDDQLWDQIEVPLSQVLGKLDQISFDMTKKNPTSVRDLFKGLYEDFIPRELRHALGEIYTPDWLVEHALDVLGWSANDDLLDPTCGTGTFILEAVRRRLIERKENNSFLTAKDTLRGLYGIDLNPLAVLAAKASLVVALANQLDPENPIHLPIFLADAINTASVTDDGFFLHQIQTDKGVREFKLPEQLVRSDFLHSFFNSLQTSVMADLDAESVMIHLNSFLNELENKDKYTVLQTVNTLIMLHKNHWDGIWCSILADRFAVGAIPQVSHIAGNPPWVKWSHLPETYANFIKPYCQAMNVFSEDSYVGGIESDISTVITFQAVRKWLAPGGLLAFYITATVFANESSQGFRRFAYPDGKPMCKIVSVEDFQSIRPFVGVSNHPALLLVKAGTSTQFPVPYRYWLQPSVGTSYSSGTDFRNKTQHDDVLAEPVPGTDAGPWLKGTSEQHKRWRTFFNTTSQPAYRARKGVTTDRNGIYFLKIIDSKNNNEKTVHIVNNPDIGRIQGIPEVSTYIETDHLFPLLRGRGIRPFCAKPDENYRILLPQRDMRADPSLLRNCPNTLRFLTQFKDELKKRSSYRRYQQGQPFWSTWSTGPYTFSPYKVLWKEISGTQFCAAYIGSVNDPLLGNKRVIPDHKCYMVPLDTIEEAQFLTGILNARVITEAIAAYAAQLSLGISVTEYLALPNLNLNIAEHCAIVSLTAAITERGGNPTPTELDHLDSLVINIMQSPS